MCIALSRGEETSEEVSVLPKGRFVIIVTRGAW